jgi:soluble lytic murein transglycosylase-like protein
MSPVILAALFLNVSAEFNLPQGLLESLCFIESSHNIKAIHKDDGNGNSVGICQVKLSTAKWLGFTGTEKDLMVPATNIYYAGKYLSKQRTRYSGSIDKAVIAYNIGHAGNLTNTIYSAKVFKQWREYKNVRYQASNRH